MTPDPLMLQIARLEALRELRDARERGDTEHAQRMWEAVQRIDRQSKGNVVEFRPRLGPVQGLETLT